NFRIRRNQPRLVFFEDGSEILARSKTESLRSRQTARRKQGNNIVSRTHNPTSGASTSRVNEVKIISLGSRKLIEFTSQPGRAPNRITLPRGAEAVYKDYTYTDPLLFRTPTALYWFTNKLSNLIPLQPPHLHPFPFP